MLISEEASLWGNFLIVGSYQLFFIGFGYVALIVSKFSSISGLKFSWSSSFFVNSLKFNIDFLSIIKSFVPEGPETIPSY